MKKDFAPTRFSFIKICLALAEHAFLFTLLLVGMAFLISALLFYAYVLPVEIRPAKISDSVLKFRKDTFQQVVGSWDAQAKKSIENSMVAPRDIFWYNPKTSKSP